MARAWRIAGVLLGASLVALPMAAAQTGSRITDNDVKALIERADQARDRFEDQLDGKVKNGVVRSATGEVQVKAALDDFQEEVGKLKSRFSDDYAASSEVETVLRRGNSLATLMKEQPSGTKGGSEWDQLASALQSLAAAYRCQFPLPEGMPVRRINDKEAASLAAQVAVQAGELKKTVGSDKTMAKPDKTALAADLDAVIKQAKTLQSRLKDNKPATADAKALKERVAALTAGTRQLPPTVLSGIGGLRVPMERLDQAFGLIPPSQM